MSWGSDYFTQATNLVAFSWTSLFTNSPTNGPSTFTDIGATNRMVASVETRKKRKTMKSKSIQHAMVLAAASLLTGFCLPTPSRAQAPVVNPGWNILDDSFVGGGPDFAGLPTVSEGVPPAFEGVPLNTFKFGSGLPYVPVGNTDTIMQRLPPATAAPGTVNLQMNTLQVQSIAPVPGTDQYDYLNLDNNTPSTGTLNINNNGTFTSTLDVYFDIRFGSLSGPIESTGKLTLNASGNWSPNAPPGALLIPGVNYDLNGVDTSADFWPVGSVIYSDSSGDQLELEPTSVPEPSPLTLLGLSSINLLAWDVRRRMAKAWRDKPQPKALSLN